MKNFCVPWVLLLLALIAAPAGAGLSVSETEDAVTVAGDHFRLTFDRRQGGEIRRIELFDGAGWNTLNRGSEEKDGATFPDLRLADAETDYALAMDATAAWKTVQVTPELVRLETRGTPRAREGQPSPFSAKLSYEIHAEGALFIDLELDLSQKDFNLKEASVGLEIDPRLVQGAKYRAQGSGTGNGGFKSGRIAFGVNPAKSYTNEVELFVESRTPLGGATDFREGAGKFRWTLGGNGAALAPPLHYTNRISLGLGAAITAKPHSQVIGQRVFHWVNFYDTKDWFPTNEQIDQMATNHGTMLVLHHEWMLNRGSNGKPHADYNVVRDHGELLRTIARAHEKGLRVGLYMRGVEPYGLEAHFFEKYLKRDWDGIYVDWHGAACVSYHEHENRPETKLGDTHFSADGHTVAAKDYFLFMKRLRGIVGPRGFLIGHQGSFNSGFFANLGFDAYLPGESNADHGMFGNVDEAVWNGMMAGGVCMPWTLDSPAFRTPAGAAKMAVWGLYPHLVMGIQRANAKTGLSRDAGDAGHAWVLPYWRILAKIDQEKAVVYNIPSQNVAAVTPSNPNFGAIVYRHEDGGLLVITANLGPTTASATLTLDTKVLGMRGSYKVCRIDSQTGTETTHGSCENSLLTSALPEWGLEGFRLMRE